MGSHGAQLLLGVPASVTALVSHTGGNMEDCESLLRTRTPGQLRPVRLCSLPPASHMLVDSLLEDTQVEFPSEMFLQSNKGCGWCTIYRVWKMSIPFDGKLNQHRALWFLICSDLTRSQCLSDLSFPQPQRELSLSGD